MMLKHDMCHFGIGSGKDALGEFGENGPQFLDAGRDHALHVMYAAALECSAAALYASHPAVATLRLHVSLAPSQIMPSRLATSVTTARSACSGFAPMSRAMPPAAPAPAATEQPQMGVRRPV